MYAVEPVGPLDPGQLVVVGLHAPAHATDAELVEDPAGPAAMGKHSTWICDLISLMYSVVRENIQRRFALPLST